MMATRWQHKPNKRWVEQSHISTVYADRIISTKPLAYDPSSTVLYVRASKSSVCVYPVGGGKTPVGAIQLVNNMSGPTGGAQSIIYLAVEGLLPNS